MRGSPPFRQADTSSCGSCGRSAHRTGELCPAIGKQCHSCGDSNHFSLCCPKKSKSDATEGGTGNGGGASGGGACGSSHEGGIPGFKPADYSSRSRVHMKRMIVGTVRARQRHRPAPTISLQFRDLASCLPRSTILFPTTGLKPRSVVWMCYRH